MPAALRPRATSVLLLTTSLTTACAAVAAPRTAAPHHVAPARPSAQWPTEGQAAYALEGQVFSSPEQRAVPIASLAKVMTAYVTVHQLGVRARLEVDADDVADAHRRRARGESVVDVAVGEVLDRDQALTALLLPSANNVAAMLAVRVAGSEQAFVGLMNDTAEQLGMTETTYTDPSGYARTTVSTARDQLALFQAALRAPELARVMATRSAVLPIAGRVRNTNSLLGHGGFVAGKTGSTSAAGGCLAFRVVREGHVVDGVVLGQRGGPLIAAALNSANALVGRALALDTTRYD